MLVRHQQERSNHADVTSDVCDQAAEWRSLAKALWQASHHLWWLPEDVLLPGLLGVADMGNDPRKVVRRIPEKELDKKLPEELRSKFTMVNRRPSGRNPNVGRKEKLVSYIEVPVDLVKCAETLYSDFPSWETAYFWGLADQYLPRLEDLRLAILRLKTRLDFHTPSLDEYAHHLPSETLSDLKNLSEDQWVQRYAESLEQVVDCETPDSLSLLAALSTESFIVDNEILQAIHRDCFHRSAQRILSSPCMSDVRDDFEGLVMARILLGTWSLPAAFHVSSLKAPFIRMDEWKRITGINEWVSLA